MLNLTVTIKHLQLNTSLLRNPQKVFDFIISNDIDIACLQEIYYKIDDQDPLQKLFENSNYSYTRGVHYHYLSENSLTAVVVISKYPVIDHQALYYNSSNSSVSTLEGDGLLSPTAVYPGSRGIKHLSKPRCILCTLIDTPVGKIRTISTHFTVTDLCTESYQMLDMSKIIKSYVENSKPYPVIFSGDLNIRPQSYSVSLLSEAMTCHTKDFSDTLSSSHPAKVKDFPQGLAVDHVFSKNLTHLSTDLVEVDFSNHQALVSQFELK